MEVFVSQGCSACVPTEAVIDHLRQRYGDDLIALVCHVTYWDSRGWKDPYSKAFCTDRQVEYNFRLGHRTNYTPQLILNAREEMNGNDEVQAQKEIDKALNEDRYRITLDDHSWEGRRNASVQFRLPPALRDRMTYVTGILFQNGPAVAVTAGENAGTTMNGIHFVRAIQRLHPDRTGLYVLPVAVAAREHPRLGAAVMVQDARGQLLATGQTFPLDVR